jgi:hypothetical protein
MVRIRYKPLEYGNHPLRAEDTPMQGVALQQRAPRYTITAVNGTFILRGPPTCPNPEEREGKATNAYPEEPGSILRVANSPKDRAEG